MSPYKLAVLILAGLAVNKRLGGSNKGFLARMGFWFAIGVLFAPVLIIVGLLTRC